MMRMRSASAGRLRSNGGSEQTEVRAMGVNGEWLDLITGTNVIGDRLVVTMLDVTERKSTARQLEEARRSLENSAFEVTENIPAGTYTMVQPPGGGFARFTFLSSRFLEMCGLTREAAERDPLNVYALVHPKDYDDFLRKNIETFERKVPFREEFRVIIRGETRWFHGASNPRSLPDGSTVWEGVLTDITARKAAEIARAEADRSMKLAASAARLGFWEIDISTRLDRWDSEMARIHGIRHEDFDGHWEKFVHPDDYDEVMRETRRMLESDEVFQMEYRIVRPSGETRYMREHGIVTRDKEGRPISASGVMQDITENKKADEQIRASAQRMRLAASAAGIGFWSRDNATGLEEWDDEMLRIYGVRREDFDGRWDPFVHPEDTAKVQRLTRDAVTSGRVGEYEYRIIRPDGAVRHIRGRSTFVPGPDGGIAREIGVNFDITNEKETLEREKQLEAEHRHELQTKLKTSLAAAAVAHEINQPLSAILLDSQMALEQIKADSPELVQARRLITSTVAHAERVVKTAERMMSLLRSVKTEHKIVDLGDVVSSAALYLKDELRANSVTLHTRGAKSGANVRGDEGQLVLAISNLLRNAIQAVAAQNKESGKILVSLDRREKDILLAIGDNGPGLDESVLAKTPLNTTKPGGTGLGLFIVKATAENHDAKLEISRSELGGAELRLVFPAAK
jgi:PAS domain S-box-containing protein